MVRFEVVEDITLKTRGGAGIGGFNKDESPELSDMNYAEKIVLNVDFVKALATLKVAKKEGDTITGGAILLTKEDILEYRKDGSSIEMNGVAHKVNQVFVALQWPFYATSYSTDDAEKVQRTGVRGKSAGKVKKVTIPDRLRIYRVTETFDINRYAADESSKVKDEGTNPYHQPTDGMILREEKWVEENGQDILAELKEFGVDLDEEA